VSQNVFRFVVFIMWLKRPLQSFEWFLTVRERYPDLWTQCLYKLPVLWRLIRRTRMRLGSLGNVSCFARTQNFPWEKYERNWRAIWGTPYTNPDDDIFLPFQWWCSVSINTGWRIWSKWSTLPNSVLATGIYWPTCSPSTPGSNPSSPRLVKTWQLSSRGFWNGGKVATPRICRRTTDRKRILQPAIPSCGEAEKYSSYFYQWRHQSQCGGTIQSHLERKAASVFYHQEYVDLPTRVARLDVGLQSIVSSQHQDGSRVSECSQRGGSEEQLVRETFDCQTLQAQVESR